ncbi:MAG: M23 family metallopeptidase [Deltaproteobacteria bacterium]|nr:M23 family metallopeptidase [Deltaproteobacteria bacterium]
MSRASLIVLTLAAAASTSGTEGAFAGSLELTTTRTAPIESAPPSTLHQLADQLGLVPRGALEQAIHWRRDLRNLVHRAAERLALLADDSGVRIPDLTILVTEPVANTESSGFGWRDDPIRHRPKFHTGTDFRGKRGTPVVAAGGGVVTFAGRMGGYGNIVHVDHGGGVITRYAHLRRIDASQGAAVAAGEQIGQVGSTGRATGPHLHFEIRLDGRPVDPVTAMTVAQLSREAPAMGKVAAFALSPELQTEASSRLDPPKQRVTSAKGSRPDRPGRVKHIRPVS